MYTIELDEKEKQSLIEILNVAVKSVGIHGDFDLAVRHIIGKIKKVEQDISVEEKK
jgi:hypothetical protein